MSKEGDGKKLYFYENLLNFLISRLYKKICIIYLDLKSKYDDITF